VLEQGFEPVARAAKLSLIANLSVASFWQIPGPNQIFGRHCGEWPDYRMFSGVAIRCGTVL
jgi:hypothetical protein